MKRKFVTTLATALILMLCLPMAASAAMLDKYAEPPEVVRSGSFEATDGARMDFSLSGGTLTGASWTVQRHGAIYALEGTFKEGEDISLSITGTETPDIAKYRVFNYMKMALSFFDSNHNRIGERQAYASEYVQDATLSHAIGGPVPPGTAEVAITGSFTCRWAGQVVVEESVAVHVNLKVEKPPEAALPVTPEPTPEPKPKPEPEPTPQPEPVYPELEKTWDFESVDWDESHHDPENEHAGPVATALITIIAAIAAVLGGAGGSAAASAAATDGRDPAYERAKVPDYPKFIVGPDGERITKRPDGIIEAAYPNGEVATHFPNGMVQVKNPDGSTDEEWPDGTVSTTDENGTSITKTPDGIIVAREPNGDETTYNPDGTSIEMKNSGLKITRNAQGEALTTERDGFVGRRHPTDPDAIIVTTPNNGSLTIRTAERTEHVRNEEGKLIKITSEHQTVEGEIRSEDGVHTYRPDGSREFRGTDGSVYVQQADGSIDASSPDGTDLKYNAKTGEMDYKSADGSYVKGNEQTGEIDAKMKDGSYWKRDDKGNGNFDDKTSGTKGVCREDGSYTIESEDGSVTQQADGTMKLQTKDGTVLVQKSDGTVTVVDKEGASLTRNPDGTGFLRKPDGTLSPLPSIPPLSR